MYYKKGMEIPEGYEVTTRSVKTLRKVKERRKCLDCDNKFWTRGDKIYCDKCLARKRKENKGGVK